MGVLLARVKGAPFEVSASHGTTEVVLGKPVLFHHAQGSAAIPR